MIGNPLYEPYWFYSDELEHHGVKGQSWGERNGPPYPLSRGKDGRITKTQKKKKASLLARAKAAVTGKKTTSRSSKGSKSAKTKESKKEETNEQIREKLLKSTDPKYIAKHIDLLDTRELKERLDRINTEQQLMRLTKDDSSKKKVDAGMAWVANMGKIAETTSKVAKAYSDTMDATAKKDKLALEKASARQDLQNKKNSAQQIAKMLSSYNDLNDDIKDIEVNFDPKTGGLSFKKKKK